MLSVDTTTVFIVGSGVSHESWAPVRRAFGRHLERIGLDGGHQVGDELANFVFAHHMLWAPMTPEWRAALMGIRDRLNELLAVS